MLGLNKLTVGAAAVLMLAGCASAVFPDFEEYDDIEVSEGGRVINEMPEESSSLAADTANAAYEDGKTVAKSDVKKKSKKAVKKTAGDSSEEQLPAVETKPVKTAELLEAEDDGAETAAKITEDDELAQNAGPSVSYRVDTFYFADGSASVDAKYNSNLRKIARKAKENNADVIVYGYASSRTRNIDPAGHKLANFKISLERAQNVAAALRRAGVAGNRISIQALSDSVPAYQEVMPEGERLNRRAEIYLSY